MPKKEDCEKCIETAKTAGVRVAYCPECLEDAVKREKKEDFIEKFDKYGEWDIEVNGVSYAGKRSLQQTYKKAQQKERKRLIEQGYAELDNK